MSFIIKSKRGLILTTTTTAAPQAPAPTTTTQSITLIDDNNVYVGGFPSFGSTYNTISPMFNEFPASTGGQIGDVTMNIVTNNTYLTSPTSTLSYSKIFVDVIMEFTNTNTTESREVELPRLTIDLPTNGLTGVLSSFTPPEAITKLRAYTNQRLAIEYDRIVVPPNGSYRLTANGSADLLNSGTDITITNITDGGINTTEGAFTFNLSRSIQNTIVPLYLEFIYRGEVLDTSNPLAGDVPEFIIFSPTTYEYDFKSPAAGIVRVLNVDIPNSLMNHQLNKRGYVEISSDVGKPPCTMVVTGTGFEEIKLSGNNAGIEYSVSNGTPEYIVVLSGRGLPLPILDSLTADGSGRFDGLVSGQIYTLTTTDGNECVDVQYVAAGGIEENDIGIIRFKLDGTGTITQPLPRTTETYNSGTQVRIVIETTRTNFGAVPYRITIGSSLTTGITRVGVQEVIGNTQPVTNKAIYTAGDILDEGMLDIGESHGTSDQGIYCEFFNRTDITSNVGVGGTDEDVNFILSIDKNNNGSYIVEQMLTYVVTPDFA